MILRLLFPFIVFLKASMAQTWETGDNSSITGCSHQCSHLDDKIDCLAKNEQFFEKVTLGQIRYLIATQASIDYYRMHKGVGPRNFSEIRDEVREGFNFNWIGGKDIITPKIMDDLSILIAERTMEIMSLGHHLPPPSHCPIPCEYTHHLYQIFTVISVLTNIITTGGFIVMFTKYSTWKNGRHIIRDQ